MKTIERTVTTSLELERRTTFADGTLPVVSAPFNPNRPRATIQIVDDKENIESPRRTGTGLLSLKRVTSFATKPAQRRARKPKLLVLREEKDRFDAMRHIQQNTAKFKRWYALCASVTAFGLLWCLGAFVFWRCERLTQDMTYFQALYFCYVSLLTIGECTRTLSNTGCAVVC